MYEPKLENSKIFCKKKLDFFLNILFFFTKIVFQLAYFSYKYQICLVAA